MPVKPKSTVRITHHRLFDTPIFSVTLEHFKVHKTKVSFNEDMISYIHGLQKDKKSRKKSNEGGWQSELLPSKQFDILFKEVYAIFQQLNLGVKEMYVSQVWANVNRKGDWNQMHLHSGKYDFCGNYYVKAPKDCGKIIFKDPRPAAIGSMFMVNRYSKGEYFHIDPEEGKLVLFPPYLEHMVEPSKTDEERISIAFDLNLG